MRVRVQVPVSAQQPARRDPASRGIGDGELDPPLVRVVGSSGEGVPHAQVPDHDIKDDRLAGRKRRPPGGDKPRRIRGGDPDGEDVDAQLLLLQKLLDASHCRAVSAHEGECGVGREKPMRSHHPVLGREVSHDCRFGWHVAVLAGLRRRGQIERARRVVRHPAVVPAVELVLPAQPAVAVHRLGQADLVAGGAIRTLAKEGLEHAGRMRGRACPEGSVVQETAGRPRGRGREDVGVHCIVRDVVVAVAAPIMDAVDRVACHARESRLRLDCSPVDFATHRSREQEHGIVASGTPFALGASHAVGGVPWRRQVAVDPAIGLRRLRAHRADRRFVERVVERREAVRRRGPLVDDIGVAALAASGSDARLGHESAGLGLGPNGVRALTGRLQGEDASGQESSGGGCRGRGEERACGWHRRRRHPAGGAELSAQRRGRVAIGAAGPQRPRAADHPPICDLAQRDRPVHDE